MPFERSFDAAGQGAAAFNRKIIDSVDRWLPPAAYRVVTDEELIEGLSFPAYRGLANGLTSAAR
jgi:hypothetical protein